MPKIISPASLLPYAVLMAAIFGLSAVSLIWGGQYDILYAFYTLPLITFLFFAFHFTGRGMKLAQLHAREEMCLSETTAFEFLAPRVLRLFALYFAASAGLVAVMVLFVSVYEYHKLGGQQAGPQQALYFYDPMYLRSYTFSTSLLVNYALAFTAGWIVLLAACLRIFRGLCRRANLDQSQNILPYFQASGAALAAWLAPWVAGFGALRILGSQFGMNDPAPAASVLFQALTLACYLVACRSWSRTCRDYYYFDKT